MKQFSRKEGWRWRGIVTTMLVAAFCVGAISPPSAWAKKGDKRDKADGTKWGADDPSNVAAEDSTGSMAYIADKLGVYDLWKKGYTGRSVSVAVIDSGIAPVPALSDPDKVVAMVDLSFEAGIPEAEFLDTYGHGTHMAGIIAGRDPGAIPSQAKDHPEWFLGIAPDAGIVSVKAGDNTGQVDVSQVIAGINWVVENASRLGIRVINLSYGTDSTQNYLDDPLAQAVEEAWAAGIVVVVAVGNDGAGTTRLSNPASDPYVLAVTAGDWKKDGSSDLVVPDWTTRGDGKRNPDVATIGAHVISLRAPGSRIDVEHPEGYVSDRLFRGSGTSQATAIVSGMAALLLDQRPELTPDDVKGILTGTAKKLDKQDPTAVGQGQANFGGARGKSHDKDCKTCQSWPRSTGLGSLDLARGSHRVTMGGAPLAGETTFLGGDWNGGRWTGARWTGGTWDGARWTGASWRGQSWTGARWTGASWMGASWRGARWTSAAWSGASWRGSAWTAASWSGASWRGDSWTGASWRDSGWSGSAWESDSYTGRVWQ